MIECREIKERKSVRLFCKNETLNKALIVECIEAATLAPSPYNVQPWYFKIIENEALIKNIGNALVNNKWVRFAPVLIIVGMKKHETIEIEKIWMSIGAAIENMILEAQSKGISTCWIGERLDKNSNLLSCIEWPSELEMVAIVAMGKKRQHEIKKTLRKSVSQVII